MPAATCDEQVRLLVNLVCHRTHRLFDVHPSQSIDLGHRRKQGQNVAIPVGGKYCSDGLEDQGLVHQRF